ncbi:MAG: hypothetical protein LBJ13_02505 [Puniceicoccales bacterium]|jgi:hypothetical protein|nr:hypothetical protein [Puniceicoccales bacterium]
MDLHIISNDCYNQAANNDIKAIHDDGKKANGGQGQKFMKVGGKLCIISSPKVIKHREGEPIRNLLRKVLRRKESRITMTPLKPTGMEQGGQKIMKAETSITFIYNKGMFLDESGKRFKETKDVLNATKSQLETKNQALKDKKQALMNVQKLKPKQADQVIKNSGQKAKSTSERAVAKHLKEDKKDTMRQILDNMIRKNDMTQDKPPYA